MWGLPQCKHILLGGSGDRGYGGFLREYTQSVNDRLRVILLKARPFTRELAEIAMRVSAIDASSLFRDTALLYPAAQSLSPTMTPHNFTRSTYAGALTVTPPSNGNPSSMTTGSMATARTAKKSLSACPVMHNSAGHRLDPRITYDKDWRKRLLSMEPRLCYNHYLRECPHDPCEFVHHMELTEAGLETLAFIARTNPCVFRHCEDLSCYFGHQCPYGTTCNRNCKFAEDQHSRRLVAGTIRSCA